MRRVIKSTSVALAALLLLVAFVPLCAAAAATCNMPCCHHSSMVRMSGACATPCAVSSDESPAPLPAVTSAPAPALPVAIVAASSAIPQPQARVAPQQVRSHRAPDHGLYLLNSVFLI